MDDDYHQQYISDTHQQPAMSSGLARYQSAPSSYFSTLLNTNNNTSGSGSSSNIIINDLHHQQQQQQICFVNTRPSTPPTDKVFSTRFMPPGNSKGHGRQLHGVPPQSSSVNQPLNTIHSHFMNKSENQLLYVHYQQHLPEGSSSSGYSSSASQMISDNQSQPSIPNYTSNPVMDCSFLPPINMGGSATNTNLLRQSSSPADFFANFDIEGYGVSKIIGNFNLTKSRSNSEAAAAADPVPSPSTPNRLKREVDFSTASSSSGIMTTPISEIENKNMEMSDGFPSWDDFSDGFLKGLEDDDTKTLSSLTALENQNNEVGNQDGPPSILSHHLSLPKASMEKLLQLQDSVPCKIRAKRGCATHPRSIAERVRRTRISERMRKLQELVPNMDKQTNTSDMLDLAVDYIKDLQDQVQTLSDNRANCTCANQETQ